MAVTGYATLIGVFVLTCGVTHAAGQDAAVATSTSLAPQEQELFLRNARIVRGSMRRLGTGVTDSRRATLSEGGITQDAHIQTVDIAMPLFEGRGASEVNFKDTYRYNVAAYRLAALLGLDSVPVSVERRVDAKMAAVTWWVDDVVMDEKGRVEKRAVGPDPVRFAQQFQVMYLFDELIQNRDRNQGNVLWTSDWKMWLIDHTRAFRLGRALVDPDRLRRCERSLLENLRGLTAGAMTERLGRILMRAEIDAVLARGALIVEHCDTMIAERGEAALFTLGR